MNYQEILEYHKQQKQEYENLKAPYKNTEAQIEKLQEKIEKLKAKKEKQLKTFYKKEEKLKHHWTDTILESIAQEVIKKYNNLNAFEILGCFGLNCEASIWFFEKEEDMQEQNNFEKIKASLTFHPLQNGVQIWTGETNNRYEEGSIGALNGGNKIMKEVTSLEQIFKQIDKSLKEMS